MKKSEENFDWKEENKENNGNFEEEIVKGNIRLLIDEVCLNLEGGFRFGRIAPRKDDFQGKYIQKQDFHDVFNEIRKTAGKFGWFNNFLEKITFFF